MKKKGRKGLKPFTAGVIALLVVIVGCYFAFTKANPFSHPYKLNAVFADSDNIRPSSPVRIAGVDRGKVTGVSPLPGKVGAAKVSMEIKSDGLPLHRDATARIRPRVFLEGNFFVDVHPGTPQSPDISSGDTIPVTQTATPVQLDQVLTTLQASTRQGSLASGARR